MAEAMPLVEPRICLADSSGELVSVGSLLNELGIAWVDHAQGRQGFVELLISTPQVAVSNQRIQGDVGARTHIVVARNLSRTLRKELERHPCDFVVEQPVDPAALRALIEHALYQGPERRSGLRAMIDTEVKVKAGFFSKKATLVQLSERGAGLLFEQMLTPDEVTLRLPPSLAGSQKFELKARLLDQHVRPGEGTVASFSFPNIDRATRARLREIMKTCARHEGMMEPGTKSARVAEPADARAATPSSANAAATAQPQAQPRFEEAGSGEDKRSSARKSFHKRVLATVRGHAQAVVSRDISAGGMRLAPDADISEGDELKLALYGAKGSPPLVLRGVVMRSDDSSGIGLKFLDVPSKMQERLDKLVSQSAISGPVDPEKGRPKMVVTEIVDRVAAGD